jgi:hypothetical protein
VKHVVPPSGPVLVLRTQRRADFAIKFRYFAFGLSSGRLRYSRLPLLMKGTVYTGLLWWGAEF